MASIEKLGDLFFISESGENFDGRLTALPGDRFAAVWSSESVNGGQGAELDGKIFSNTGAGLGGAFPVSSPFSGDIQEAPSAAALGDRGFVAAWVHRDPFTPSAEIEAQIVAADGTRTGANLQVNTDRYGLQWQPTVTQVGDDFLVVWTTADPSADGSGSALKAQLFDSNGARIGGEYLANGAVRNDQEQPVAVGLHGGGYALFWSSDDLAGTTLPASAGSEIKGQFFDAQGQPIGGELVVNSNTATDQARPAAAVLASGAVAVIWTTNDHAADGSGSAIKGQVFGSDGKPLGSEFLVNSVAADFQNNPAIAAVGNGFVATWDTHPQGNFDAVIKAQAFDGSGAKLGGEFLVSDSSGDYSSQDHPDIVGLDNGRFVIGWDAVAPQPYDGLPPDYHVLGQVFQETSGSPTGGATQGADTIQGTSADDLIAGLGGDDEIHGGDGRDRLSGNAGNDLVYGDAGDDTVNGNQGNDTLHGQDGADILYGEDGGDELHGGDGADKLNGQAGDDMLHGDAGEDLAFAGDGNDQLFGDGGNDTLHGDAGADTLHGGDGADSISGGENRDFLYGDAGSDALFGQGGNDRLFGGAQNDRLIGGDGDDFLYGGAGDDVLNGGKGSDTFYLYFGPASAGVDAIQDFVSGVDKIGVSARGFGLPPGTLDPSSFSVGPGPSGPAAGFFFNPANHSLYWDGDGTGANPAIALATLMNHAEPTAADFIVL